MKAIRTTKGSTASLGRFDPVLKNEPKPKGIKRSFEPTTSSSLSSEKEKQSKLLDSIVSKEGVLNITKAVRHHNREQRQMGRPSFEPANKAQRSQKKRR